MHLAAFGAKRATRPARNAGRIGEGRMQAGDSIADVIVDAIVDDEPLTPALIQPALSCGPGSARNLE